MKNWIIILLVLLVAFLAVIMKKIYFLIFIIPLFLFWKK